MKRVKPYPYLYRDKDRHGLERWRFRAPGQPTVTIKGAFGSPEFAANYRGAVERAPVEPGGVFPKHGTFEALCRSYLRSGDFLTLAPETQRTRRAMVERLSLKLGKCSVAGLNANRARLLMGEYASKPGIRPQSIIEPARAYRAGDRRRDPNG